LETTTNKGSTALFVGDEAHFLWPGAVEAAIKLLQALGENPIPISRGKSNGFLASSLGLLDTARNQASTILEELDVVGATKLVVLSPGDAFTFADVYNERLGLSWPDTVEVVDLITLLAKALSSGKLVFESSTDGETGAYVDPTHASRTPSRYESPRLLLAAVLPVQPLELFWRKKRTHPVGNTSLQFTHPELAKALTRGRLEDARSRGVEVLYTEDPSTLFHLQSHAPEYDLKIRGLYETLEASLSS
jgi:Fe-S oxidoreductase